MSRFLAYLRARLSEAGTIRSLAVVLFAITGAGNSQQLWEGVIYLVIALLGLGSAMKPESKP